MRLLSARLRYVSHARGMWMKPGCCWSSLFIVIQRTSWYLPPLLCLLSLESSHRQTVCWCWQYTPSLNQLYIKLGSCLATYCAELLWYVHIVILEKPFSSKAAVGLQGGRPCGYSSKCCALQSFCAIIRVLKEWVKTSGKTVKVWVQKWVGLWMLWASYSKQMLCKAVIFYNHPCTGVMSKKWLKC